jgi:DNA-binding NtrC family response regulator/tetratricopeptide (TPR) repeat protein
MNPLLNLPYPPGEDRLLYTLKSLVARGRHAEAEQMAHRGRKGLPEQYTRAFLSLRADIAVGLGRFSQALEWAIRGLGRVDLRDGVTRSLEAAKIRALIGLGRFREAKWVLENRYIELDRRGVDRKLFEAHVALHTGQHSLAAEAADEACDAAQLSGERLKLVDALMARARAYRESGDTVRARRDLDRAERLSSGLRDASALATVLSDRADLMAHEGDWTEAEKNASRAGRLFARALSPHEHLSAGRRTGLLGLAQGDPRVALPTIQKAADFARRGFGATDCRAEIDLLLADAQLAGRDPEGALERASAALSLFRYAQDPGGLARAHVRRSLAAHSASHVSLALREAYLARAIQGSGPVAEGLADLALGRVLLKTERPRAAAPFGRAVRNGSLYPPLRFVARLGVALAEGASPQSDVVQENVRLIETFGDRRILSIVRTDLHDLFGIEPADSGRCESAASYGRSSEDEETVEFLPGLVGASETVQELSRLVRKAAPSGLPVSIHGETGTGKENVARAIHALSSRTDRKFVPFSAASLSDELFESQLFGHVKGSFTGALNDRAGLVEEAKGGTLFIDEVADLSARSQDRLLRFLQDGKYRRVGENHERHADVRIVVAANQSLSDLVKTGRFREDLMYRLQGLRLSVPPLRDRGRDILRLARHFVSEASGQRARLSEASEARLLRYPWPGNVRELQLEMKRAVVFSDSPRIEWMPPLVDGRESHDSTAPPPAADAGPTTLDEALGGFERTFLKAVLSRCPEKAEAARLLGISRQSLHQKILRYAL